MSRAGIYKGPNVTFDPKSCEAFSYAWWCFVKRIRGKVVFNSYRYSVTTAKHQRRVRDLLAELGVRIDREVQVPAGLQGLHSLREVNEAHAIELIYARRLEEAKRAERNRKAKARRAQAKLSRMQLALASKLPHVSQDDVSALRVVEAEVSNE